MQRGIREHERGSGTTKDTNVNGPRNYDNPEPLNTSHKGKAVVIALVNGRSESGILKALGQYTLELELQNKKTLIINKSAILTVSIL